MVCVVYDVTNEDTIDKVVNYCLSYIVSYCTVIPRTCVTCRLFFFQIKTKWIPLVNGDAEKGNKYVLESVCVCVPAARCPLIC